jgi:DNA-binding transcriptional LysR family regulator
MDKRRAPRLSLDLLRGFRAAARHLSFTRAAQELSVTQSAISREIKTLEEQLGQPLFHRVHRALRLTRAGEELYRAADEALTQLDAVTDRLTGAGRALSVTTTSGLASLWLAPRLPRFNRAHPGIDVQIVASNDKPDLERDRLDVAIRFVQAGADLPDNPDRERLFGCESFPVCSPRLTSDHAHPLRTPADLAHHVRLDYETVRDGRRLSEWQFWFDAMDLRAVSPASTLRFPQYDQVVAAAIEGSGVAMGVLPHVAEQLRDRVLCAPFGEGARANRGAFFIVLRRDLAGRDAAEAFVAWLRSEVRRDAEMTLASPRAARRSPRRQAMPSAPQRTSRR